MVRHFCTMIKKKKIIWTIGHSTRPFEYFLKMLHSFNIQEVVDIRSFPGSRKYPHYNKELLEQTLPQDHLAYYHLKNLGGRRKPNRHSKNTAWRVAAFRSYADYMETEDFHTGILQLEKLALHKKVAFMCAEAVWWRCHRSMVSDYLKSTGWTVYHIMDIEKEEEHPYTAPAKIINGKLSYSA